METPPLSITTIVTYHVLLFLISHQQFVCCQSSSATQTDAAANIAISQLPARPVVDNFYYVRDMNVWEPMSESKQVCVENGGFLPSPRTLAQFERLTRALAHVHPDFASYNYWLDVQRDPGEGEVWRHADGTAMAFRKWGEYSPRTGSGRDCMSFGIDSDGSSVGMTNVPCNMKVYTVCAYAGDVPPSIDDDDDDDDSYKYSTTAANATKFMSWYEAKRFCEDAGGSLASPRTAAQFERIKEKLALEADTDHTDHGGGRSRSRSRSRSRNRSRSRSRSRSRNQSRSRGRSRSRRHHYHHHDHHIRYWLGIRRNNSLLEDGTWRHQTDGSSLAFDKWTVGSPSATGIGTNVGFAADCAFLLLGSGTMEDDSCSSRYRSLPLCAYGPNITLTSTSPDYAAVGIDGTDHTDVCRRPEWNGGGNQTQQQELTAVKEEVHCLRDHLQTLEARMRSLADSGTADERCSDDAEPETEPSSE